MISKDDASIVDVFLALFSSSSMTMYSFNVSSDRLRVFSRVLRDSMNRYVCRSVRRSVCPSVAVNFLSLISIFKAILSHFFWSFSLLVFWSFSLLVFMSFGPHATCKESASFFKSRSVEFIFTCNIKTSTFGNIKTKNFHSNSKTKGGPLCTGLIAPNVLNYKWRPSASDGRAN